MIEVVFGIFFQLNQNLVFLGQSERGTLSSELFEADLLEGVVVEGYSGGTAEQKA
jgi:hypothetical protein